MKNITKILLLLIGFVSYGQITPVNTLQIKFPRIGASSDSVIVWRGSDKLIGYVPASELPISTDTQMALDDILNTRAGWRSPQDYGAIAGDGIDDTVPFKNCLDNNLAVFLYGDGGYDVDINQLNIRDNHNIYSNNAIIKNNSTSGTILNANGVSDWKIGGFLTIEGGGNVSGTQKGLYVIGATNFKIDNIYFNNIAGDPVEFDDVTPTGRGNRGLVYNLSAKDNYGSVLFNNRAEYHTIQNVNIQGSSTVALKILAGNVSVIGGSIVDNANGVFIGGGGANNSHGILANLNVNHNDLTGGYNARFDEVDEGQTVVGCHFYGGARNIEIVESKGVSFTGCIIDGEIENIDSTPANNWTHLFNGCQINSGTSVVGVTQNLIFRDCFTMTGIYSNTPDPTVIQTTTDQTKTGLLTLIGGGPGTFKLQRESVGTLFANSSTDDGYLAYNLGGTSLFYRVFGNGNITIGQAAGIDTLEKLQVNGEVKVGPAVAATSATPLGQVQSIADAKVADSIINGVTTIAPSQNAVFDALALKADNTSLPVVITQNEVIDFPDPSSHSAADATPFTVTGAAVGDEVIIVPPLTILNDGTLIHCVYSAFVSATNEVTARVQNPFTSGVTIPSATYKIIIRK